MDKKDTDDEQEIKEFREMRNNVRNDNIQYIEENRALVTYLNAFKDINITSISKISQEKRFILKQFLYKDYLSVQQIVDILEETDFKAAYSNVFEKITELDDNLKLIEKTLPSSTQNLDNRCIYYRLRSIGLFYMLKDIEMADVKHGDEETPVAIFKNYTNDLLFQIFIYILINKETLSNITDDLILWEFINYLKQICQNIDKELINFINFYKNNMIEEQEALKWPYNLKNDKSLWNKFCYKFLWRVKGFPISSSSDSPNDIVNANISSNHISFELEKRKYLIKLDEQNNIAKLFINDRESRTRFNIKKAPHCFIFYKIKYFDEIDFLDNILGKLNYYIYPLKFQFGISILRLFNEDYFTFMDKYSTFNLDLKDLAKDDKIKSLVNEIYSELNKHFKEFTWRGK